MVCPLYRGCPLLRGSNRIILIGRDKFGDLVLSIVERYLIQCPFLGGSSLRGSTVIQSMFCYLGLGTELNGQVMSFAWFVVQKGLIIRIDTTDEQDLDL